jgi:hypothetical protein
MTAEEEALRFECLKWPRMPLMGMVSPGQTMNRETGLLNPPYCWLGCSLFVSECMGVWDLSLTFFGELGLRLGVSKFFDT